MSDPKANPDVLHVDGPTRDAIIEALRSSYSQTEIVGRDFSGYAVHGPSAMARAADLIESRFPVSAEPSPDECSACASDKPAVYWTEDGESMCVDCVVADLEEAWRRLHAEPSPNPLREALERAEREMACIAVDLHENGMHPDDAAEYLAKECERAREALAADQSQSDRTSDEATPAEPG